MNTSKDGGPAFPVSVGMGPLSANFASPGMTLRDWFAGMALQGFFHGPSYSLGGNVLAKMAYDTADAMLKEREK